mmetsp:Transcript_33186/g.23927  ORF Transcript_33186/g.23927 Transcript_33186/m.23927 type:complete len:95 (+) Transcript_33186:1210-1494(+)
MLKWMRLGGFILMVLAFSLFFSPILALLGWIPIIGPLLKSIVGFAVFILSFIVAMAFSMLTIALAWLFYRPFVGISLILTMGVMVYVSLMIAEK